jgi:phosphoribosylamine---glycine ligase
MKILLIGSGGREHAIGRALAHSLSTTLLYAVPGNPGIFKLALPANININNFNEISAFCKDYSIDMVVVGPEQPLADGIADYFQNEKIVVFGPSQKAAQLESSKGFAKEFMQKYNIPTANFKRFSIHESSEAHNYIDSQNCPIVLKADGLAAGKGVIISQNHEEAHKSIDFMFGGLFGSAGNSIVIEEYLSGEEASILAICDGNDYITLAPSQDHKRIFDGDRGANTGGMGAYAPARLITPELNEKICRTIIEPTLDGMKIEGSPFVGCLYAGLMIENREPKVIEFNVRFGDPETQAVLSAFDGDFAKLLFSAATGKIDKSAIKSISNGYACCVIMASQGYPEHYEKGFPITGIDEAESHGVNVFHAGTVLKEDILVSSGGRVLGVTGIGVTLKDAIDESYKAVRKIHFDNMFFRKDIGAKGLKYSG